MAAVAGAAAASAMPGSASNTVVSTIRAISTIRIDVNDYERPAAIAEDSPDNRIISVAWHLHEAGGRAEAVTGSGGMRALATGVGDGELVRCHAV